MDRLGVMRGLRLVLFGDGAWAANSLLRLMQGPHRVVAVVLRHEPSDGTLGDSAAALEIPVLQPQKVNDARFVARVRQLRPDLGLSIAYNQILRAPLLASAPLGFLNFHAGKLPFYRGRCVINWAIINGETEVGVTAHFIDEGIDTGPVLLQRTVPVGWTDTYGDVLHRVVGIMPFLVEEALSLVARGEVHAVPQSAMAGTYFAARQVGDEWLDWSDTSVNLHNKVRGITRPGPGARTNVGRRTVIVWGAHYHPAWPKYLATPGQVVGMLPNVGVLVKTGDSTLLLNEVQVDGQQPEVPRWPIGTRLGSMPLAQSSPLRVEPRRIDAASP